MERKYISVLTLNKYIKAKMDKDVSLQNVYIKGEISNYRPHPSGHLYFTLKDENSKISAVMFYNNAKKLELQIENGMQVLVKANVSVYVDNGVYQLYVLSMEQDGIGKLYFQYEQLKIRLKQEGLFNESHKKKIPSFPRSIAVLSAKQGAAVQDVVHTIQLRFPFTKVIVFPIPVQGQGAYIHIIDILKRVDQLKFDTIIIARGGGSIEELWNFNEEALARCIYDLDTPIISAIGHETDFTICDFVSDYRAITPTDAGILATPDQNELKRYNDVLKQRLTYHMKKYIEFKQLNFTKLQNAYCLKNPDYLYSHDVLKLNQLQDQLNHQFQMFEIEHKKYIENQAMRLHQILNHNLTKIENTLQKNILQLDALSPLKVMQRGYTLIKKDEQVIKNSKQLKSGDEVDILFNDGLKKAQIK